MVAPDRPSLRCKVEIVSETDLTATTTSIARAVKLGDAEAERAARRQLAALRVRRELEAARQGGVTFTREERAELGALIGVGAPGSADGEGGRVEVHGPVVPLRPSPQPRPVTQW